MNHDDKIIQAEEVLKSKHEEIRKTKWYPTYHVAPQAGWMNDPNGFSFYNGEYHLFYQHYPFSPQWGPMYWGHAKSRDLASWEHLPIALAPSEDYDKDGCFSGSAIQIDDKLYLMYTGNVWTGDDHDHQLKQVQCIASSQDGIHFTKDEQNPVISTAPEGNIHPFHFRDPKVWKKGEHYYCVLGSKTNQNIGQILLYRSKDLVDWEFMNVAATGTGNFGYMWECPDIFNIDGQDILLMSPQGMAPEGYMYHNLHQSGYVVGKLDYETGILEHGPFQLLDYGFDVYAPQTTVDEQGRRIVLSWMNMWESEMPEQKYEWAGAITLPRVMTLENGTLRISPVPELKSLRKDKVAYERIQVNGNELLPKVDGSFVELKVTIDAKDATQFGLKVRVNEDLGEETVLYYDTRTKVITFNRDNSGAGPKGIRQAPVELIDNKLHLHLFLDSSSVELFINEGEKVMTGRIYPNEESIGIQFFSEGEIELLKVEKWTVAGAF
ncbi:glycoside hydrolase family 32 protein [Bacillus luteolus]|uniref:Sucrose-6-phosphate hydrolase n=1 Tax=Litchfieldia luteola TaxID=682179 RepID=A0ABR9QJ05_9BACI|nr:glycoside hydrolase family 32 protein [Cytobacillus luteolus]MBE4908475.1 glycoside hydrolase family 32 protein [Cytobacillus luteolus]MBP1941326.1 beta-fructofuranosidase [Cytobacillus luteolus]